MDKAQEMFAGEQARLHAAVSAAPGSPGQADRIKAAAAAVKAAR